METTRFTASLSVGSGLASKAYDPPRTVKNAA